MAHERRETPLAPITPQAPKTTADRWDEYRAMQAQPAPPVQPAPQDQPRSVIAERVAPEVRTREEAPIAERVVADSVGVQKAGQISTELKAQQHVDLAAIKGEDGFEKDTYTAPIEGSAGKQSAEEDKGFKFRNPFVRRPLT